MEGEWKMPDWWYRDKRPPNDDVYFENMSRIIFQAGLNWSVIEKKWPSFRNAFAGFSAEKVSHFTDADVERLMKDAGIVRNRGKIRAIIYNAGQFVDVKKKCGSFRAFLDSLDRSNNYAKVVKELTAKFKWLGPSSASMFLFTVGEKIEHLHDM
jgi:DNA-3-methyladenine glycosylase I